MKRFISAVLVVLMLLSFTACEKSIPGQFVATQEYINQKLEANGFDVTAEALDKGRGGGTIETAVSLSTAIKSSQDDIPPLGTLYLEYENSFCHRLRFVTYMQYKGWNNSEKIISFLCDLYGANNKAVISQIEENFETGANLEYGTLDSIETEFIDNGFYYSVSFCPEIEGDYSLENLNLVSVIIEEEGRYKAAAEEGEQNRLKFIADNPLLYSDGEPDWPQWNTESEINRILADSNLPFTAEFDYYSRTDTGTANTAYGIYNTDGEKAGDISTVRFASGYEYSVLHNILDGYNIKIRMDTEEMLQIACGVSDIEYSDELLDIVNDYLLTEELKAYFEYNGYYWHVYFYSDYAGDLKYNRYLYTVSVYEPDVLKGRLLSRINSSEQNSMDYKKDKEIYDRFFG